MTANKMFHFFVKLGWGFMATMFYNALKETLII